MTLFGSVAESVGLAALMVGVGAWKMWRLRRSEEKFDERRRKQTTLHSGR